MLPTVTLGSFPPSNMLATVKNQNIGKKMLPTVKLRCFQPSKMLPMVYGKTIHLAECTTFHFLSGFSGIGSFKYKVDTGLTSVGLHTENDLSI